MKLSNKYPLQYTPGPQDSPHKIGSGSGTGPLDYESRDPVPDPETLPFKYFLTNYHSILKNNNNKQVAQRTMIAHLSPMCQGQISFQKHINGPWKPEARNQTHPSFYACPGYQQL